jgi:hypothetical protein
MFEPLCIIIKDLLTNLKLRDTINVFPGFLDPR